MCVILDVNRFSDFMDKANQDMEPVRNWLRKKNSKVAFSPTEKFRNDWKGREKTKVLERLKQAGKLRIINKDEVDKESEKVKENIKSNDEHIIALARISGVKVLISNDGNLQKDFLNRELVQRGKLYKNASHKGLLKRDLCS